RLGKRHLHGVNHRVGARQGRPENRGEMGRHEHAVDDSILVAHGPGMLGVDVNRGVVADQGREGTHALLGKGHRAGGLLSHREIMEAVGVGRHQNATLSRPRCFRMVRRSATFVMEPSSSAVNSKPNSASMATMRLMWFKESHVGTASALRSGVTTRAGSPKTSRKMGVKRSMTDTVGLYLRPLCVAR